MASSAPVIEPIQGVDICFNDTKAYWKFRSSVEIVVACHTGLKCFEVVCFHPELGKEAPRIYLDAQVIFKHIDKVDMDARITDKKEQLLRSKKPFEPAAIVKEVSDAMALTYVMSRINILHMPANDQDSFVMALSPQTGDTVVDEETHRLDVVMAHKPEKLVPIAVRFSKKMHVSSSDVLSALKNVQEEAAELKRATYFAELATTSVEGFKSLLANKDKWKNFSPARIRWAKAVGRILTQLYVKKVIVRLEELELVKAQRLELLAREEDDQRRASQKMRKPKILRRSLDNSSISSNPNALPAINSPTRSASRDFSSTSNDGLTVSLPSLSIGGGSPDAGGPNSLESPTRRLGQGSSRRPRGAALQRRSFGDERSFKGVETGSSKGGDNVLSKYGGGGGSGFGSFSEGSQKINSNSLANSQCVPSLLQSFNTKSSILLTPLSPQAAFNMSEGVNRSMKA